MSNWMLCSISIIPICSADKCAWCLQSAPREPRSRANQRNSCSKRWSENHHYSNTWKQLVESELMQKNVVSKWWWEQAKCFWQLLESVGYSPTAVHSHSLCYLGVWFPALYSILLCTVPTDGSWKIAGASENLRLTASEHDTTGICARNQNKCYGISSYRWHVDWDSMVYI